jgi:hypothetical protein
MKFFNVLLITSVLLLAVSCKKTDTPKSSEAKLLAVTCSFGNGVLDTATNSVVIKAPENTDVTQIIAEFDISKNATIYPPSGVVTDFTNPVTYTIKSEDNSGKYIFTIIVRKPIVKFTVYDCSNWTPASFRTLQANAVINIFTKSEDVGTTKTYDVLTSDSNGEAILYGARTNNYYFTANKDNKSNIVNGYVLLGTYNTQAEVDGSPDTAARIGGLWFKDVNGDGRFRSDDKCSFDFISGEYDLNTDIILPKDLYIANKN